MVGRFLAALVAATAVTLPAHAQSQRTDAAAAACPPLLNQQFPRLQEIAQFCENTFGVPFPMFAMSSVRGRSANPRFKELAASTGRQPLWNFHKYLVGRDGRPVAQFASTTAPDNKAFMAEIETLLAARP